jgi:two-component system, OmpR family, KDP operon response regulator KdpE
VNVRLLVIEDDPQVRRFLRTALSAAGYDVFEAETGRRGLAEAAARRADAILLDLGLPDMDGNAVLDALRRWSTVPVIVVSARGQESAKIRALDEGADDFVVKPFSTGELLARLRVALRRWSREGRTEEIYAGHDVRIDLGARTIDARGEAVRLTPTEFKLLAELVRHAGQVVTQRQLLRAVWGPGHVADTHYLRLYMAQLRKKLEKDPTDPQLLLTEQGIGYRLAAD